MKEHPFMLGFLAGSIVTAVALVAFVPFNAHGALKFSLPQSASNGGAPVYGVPANDAVSTSSVKTLRVK